MQHLTTESAELLISINRHGSLHATLKDLTVGIENDNAEERLFRVANKAFVESRVSVRATRELWSRGEAFDRKWCQQAAELGWTSLLVPEALGGASVTGNGLLDLVGVVELLGANASPGPLNVVSTVLDALVSEAAMGEHDELIESLIAGEVVATWAVGRVGGAWNPLAPTVSASRTGAGWELSGTAAGVEFGAEADVLLVVAATEQGPIEVIVEAGAPGVTVTSTGSVDLVRLFADVTFEGTTVDESAVVLSGTSAPAAIMHQAQVMNVLQVAESAAATGRVFDFTVQWGFDRYSFGRPLVSYQALKHRYAHNSTWLQASRAIARAAARAVQAGSPDAAHVVSAAKSWVGDRSVAIIQDCMQLHGGISQTMDHDINVYLRRAVVDRMLYGTPREHRELVAALLIDGDVAA